MERVTNTMLCILAVVVLLAAVGCEEKEAETQGQEVKQRPRETPQRQYRTERQQDQTPQASAAQPQQDQSQQQPIAQAVYVAPHSGECYHLNPNCRALSNAQSVQRVSKESAVQAGYRACGICVK